MTIPTKKAPPPRVGPCQPQKMIMNSKSSVINTELREKRSDGHVDETEACETGKSIHQTNESVMPYPSLLLLSDVIRLLAFSMVALDRSTVLMALLAHRPAKERRRTRDRRTNGDRETKDPERKEPRQKNEGALFYRCERTRRITGRRGKTERILMIYRTPGTNVGFNCANL
ncbi:hypothetical protein ALC57_12984 [Trachymyrmex cornetzi]|uniref:Uncharacterized protein n=1 Tax=Trachymyrmex cornetzi TaxID=471704 RepID=A0A195DPN0_9HYME|nr:hypothetical protein ALC57_12984 [Trachymyrmex cornetzi]